MNQEYTTARLEYFNRSVEDTYLKNHWEDTPHNNAYFCSLHKKDSKNAVR